MELKKFIGTCENKSKDKFIFTKKDNKSLNATFISGKTNMPVIREYCNGLDSTNMHTELGYYEDGIEVELWEKGKGFQLLLTYDSTENLNFNKDYCLHPGLSRYEEDEYLDKYDNLFGALDERYRKIL